MNILLSGGAKNGKSYYAQKLAREMAEKRHLPLYYLATMIPCDEEDEKRIARHVKERKGWGFETIEQGSHIMDALTGTTCLGKPVDSNGVFLLDSVTALLSNEMFPIGKPMDLTCKESVASQLVDLANFNGNIVFVSDYIYSDARTFDDFTETYRQALAFIDCELAKVCHQVIEVAFGFKYYYK